MNLNLSSELRSSMKIEVVVLGFPSLIVIVVSVDVVSLNLNLSSELRSCVTVEVAVLGPLPLIVLMVSVVVKKHLKKKKKTKANS